MSRSRVRSNGRCNLSVISLVCHRNSTVLADDRLSEISTRWILTRQAHRILSPAPPTFAYIGRLHISKISYAVTSCQASVLVFSSDLRKLVWVYPWYIKLVAYKSHHYIVGILCSITSKFIRDEITYHIIKYEKIITLVIKYARN